MIDRLRNEPALLLVAAAAVVVLGIDLAELSDAVEQIVQLVALAGAGVGIRRKVTPTHTDKP